MWLLVFLFNQMGVGLVEVGMVDGLVVEVAPISTSPL